jgi:catechol 2,3-dioxygenase-like lactoylglutathione lyase family enzyme
VRGENRGFCGIARDFLVVIVAWVRWCMLRSVFLATVVVRDYDEAIAFYVNKIGFALLEDEDRGGGKRWVRVGPAGGGAALLLAKAVTAEQQSRVGNQTGGRVMMFVETDDFERDYVRMCDAGVVFTQVPRREKYGTVAVFEDLYGNRFDLIQHVEA